MTSLMAVHDTLTIEDIFDLLFCLAVSFQTKDQFWNLVDSFEFLFGNWDRGMSVQWIWNQNRNSLEDVH